MYDATQKVDTMIWWAYSTIKVCFYLNARTSLLYASISLWSVRTRLFWHLSRQKKSYAFMAKTVPVLGFDGSEPAYLFCCQIVNYENEWARKSTDRYEYKWCRQRRVPVESIIHIIYIWPSIFCPFAVINYNLMDR